MSNEDFGTNPQNWQSSVPESTDHNTVQQRSVGKMVPLLEKFYQSLSSSVMYNQNSDQLDSRIVQDNFGQQMGEDEVNQDDSQTQIEGEPNDGCYVEDEATELTPT